MRTLVTYLAGGLLLLAACGDQTAGLPTVAGDPLPSQWRTEVWRDVQIEVPDSWALGYAPMAEGDGALLCGIGVHESTRRPYVGRPGYGSDMCQSVELEDLVLDGEGVWFGSPLPEGEVLAKSGFRQTTVVAGDSRLTVSTRDDTVRERILDSVEVVVEDANGCPARPRATRGHPVEGYGAPAYLSVCVYAGDGPGPPVREWSERLGRSEAEGLVSAVEQRVPGACPARCLAPCFVPPSAQTVLLRVHGKNRGEDEPVAGGDMPRDYLVQLGDCSSLEVAADGMRFDQTPDLVRPWAGEGVRTYVVGNGPSRALDRYFRPIWG